MFNPWRCRNFRPLNEGFAHHVPLAHKNGRGEVNGRRVPHVNRADWALDVRRVLSGLGAAHAAAVAGDGAHLMARSRPKRVGAGAGAGGEGGWENALQAG